jgi:hypothetical protein
MKVRLIKLDTSAREEQAKRPPDEVPIIDTIRSWVHEFQSTKAHRARLDFERISNAGKTSNGISADKFKVVVEKLFPKAVQY